MAFVCFSYAVCTHPLSHSPTHPPHPLTHSPAHTLTHSPTHPLIHPPTHVGRLLLNACGCIYKHGTLAQEPDFSAALKTMHSHSLDLRSRPLSTLAKLQNDVQRKTTLLGQERQDYKLLRQQVAALSQNVDRLQEKTSSLEVFFSPSTARTWPRQKLTWW